MNSANQPTPASGYSPTSTGAGERQLDSTTAKPLRQRSLPAPIAILGVPFDIVTMAGTLELIEEMIISRKPHYAATANVDFVVQAMEDIELRRILLDAHLVLADGMPLVWASRWLGNPLPERVTGSDLVPRLLCEAERKGWRVFFLGGSEQSVAIAAEKSLKKHPNLKIVGAYSPPFKSLLEMDHEDIVRRVCAASPDVLLVAFGCPKQEKWINMHFRKLGVPLSVGVGATIDFLAGTMKRAPVWMQRTGTEWIYRMLQEPRRLFRRYGTDLWIFSRAIFKQWWHMRTGRAASRTADAPAALTILGKSLQVLELPSRLDAEAVRSNSEQWNKLAEADRHLLVDMSKIEFIDSTGAGLLVRFERRMRGSNRQILLLAPSKAAQGALTLMRITDLLPTAPNLEAAREMIARRIAEQATVVTPKLPGAEAALAWQGEIVAANADEVWRSTEQCLDRLAGNASTLTINLAGVRFMDSTGVGLMVRARKQADLRGIEVQFLAPSPAVQNVLRTLRLLTMISGRET
ncbi:MAG: WecB/TagA/CpsF family glycosyltransferase [Verrucomicrobiota bacterium]